MSHSIGNQQVSLRAEVRANLGCLCTLHGTISRLNVEQIWVHGGIFAESLTPVMTEEAFWESVLLRYLFREPLDFPAVLRGRADPWHPCYWVETVLPSNFADMVSKELAKTHIFLFLCPPYELQVAYSNNLGTDRLVKPESPKINIQTKF